MTFFGGMKSRYQIGAYKSHCIRRLYPYKVLAEDSPCPKWYCWLYIVIFYVSHSLYPIISSNSSPKIHKTSWNLGIMKEPFLTHHQTNILETRFYPFEDPEKNSLIISHYQH